MDSSTRVLLPEIWERVCRGLSVWSCLQLGATDKRTMGRLVAAGVLDAVDRMVIVGRDCWPIGIHVKRYKWFDREYITRIIMDDSREMITKSIEYGSAQVLVLATDDGHRYIYIANGKAKHVVCTLKCFGATRFFLVMAAVGGALDVHEFIWTWMNEGRELGKKQLMRSDRMLETQLTFLFIQSGVPAHSLLMRPDVVALLSPK